MNRGGGKKWKTRILRGLLLVLCAAAPVVAWVGFGDRGILHLLRLETEREAYLERIKDLNRENHTLMAEIERLRTDMKYVEKVARKELGLIKENEVIYRVSGAAAPKRGDTDHKTDPRERENPGNAGRR